MTNEVIVAYALLVNIVSFSCMYVDKQRARKGQWRIAEKHIWVLALIGGTIGILGAMKLFRHKTKHLLFKRGIPFLLLLQIVLFVIINYTSST